MTQDRLSRRRLMALGAALAAPLASPALLLPRAARAQGEDPAHYPGRALRLIVPVAPGGSQDLVARLLAKGMGEVLGQTVQVENLPGAGSNIGYEAAARARPDGYTLLAGSDSLSINAALFPRLTYDPLRAFAPILPGVAVPQILVVRREAPQRSLAEFVAAARGGSLAVGTPGNGSLSHLVSELMQQSAEIRWTHVPYRGGALAINDLLAGHLEGVWINIGAVTDHVRSGRLRGLAVSSPARAAALPEVPTLEEGGFQGLSATGWHGLVAPAGIDPGLAARLTAAGRAALRKPDVAERLAGLGVEPLEEPPEALGRRILADAGRWVEVVRRAGIRPD
ncbi:Bug family tripartite tricarboxylate transporter substrate binding protein [Teichococcus vastitatis]|uniref:Tripartite tricarboxylate transporter substrate binding protein n=1 Tax=Teichococcus vastitatis TaxID=2307076 RepID=A0ABS9WAY7_9PROT|nr:tripartite tricarboxylate transporter substrate-binding protein [Pseudoroseomonas vastitatis]MCI0756471.1 tripartite tricarboxylate transporter substrate binding protein [Pseudoroseomonas vastitatis]